MECMQTSASPAHRCATLPSTSPARPQDPLASADETPPPFGRGIVWCRRAEIALDAPLCHWLPPPNAIDGVGPSRKTPQRVARGGLSGWQRRAVADHIEANIGAPLRLGALAQLVRLSPYHFARAFKQSFGVPPHRYHVGRRIARAKDLLGDPDNSVTAIARELGFAETSSFSSTFRRVTGASPSDFRRARL
jgi:AraC-like DNA-binding protein